MSSYAVRLLTCCGLCLLAACASTPEPTAETHDAPTEEASESAEPSRPEFHSESDAERLSRDAARQIARPVCGSGPEARDCRRTVGRGALAYRGEFSAAGADEVIVVSENSAVLVRNRAGNWAAASRIEDVDIRSCLVTTDDDGGHGLLCRVPVFREDGYGLEVYRVDASADGELAIDALDVPKAGDVDSVLFAGWKNDADRVHLRLHAADQVASARTTIDMGGAGGCRHDTYAFEPTGQLRPVDRCTTDATLDQGAGANTAYENRLGDPLMKRNRQYVRCYRDELQRLEEEAELREKLEAQCDEGTAPDDVDCEETFASEDDAEDDEDAESSAERQEPAGQIQTRLVIGSPGSPVACRVVSSELQNERVETCLCRELMQTEFPPVPEGSFFDVTYPFNFTPDLAR